MNLKFLTLNLMDFAIVYKAILTNCDCGFPAEGPCTVQHFYDNGRCLSLNMYMFWCFCVLQKQFLKSWNYLFLLDSTFACFATQVVKSNLHHHHRKLKIVSYFHNWVYKLTQKMSKLFFHYILYSLWYVREGANNQSCHG